MRTHETRRSAQAERVAARRRGARAAEAALSEVLDENARLREALEGLLEADLPSHFDPRTITAWQEARTLARAALSPWGGRSESSTATSWRRR
jgi:hypothetical protein